MLLGKFPPIVTTFLLFSCCYLLWERILKSKTEDRVGIQYSLAEKPLLGKYEDILNYLGFNDEPIRIDGNYPDFTFVTALSDNHVGEGRHLVVNMSRAFPERKIVVYSMGLSDKNLEWFKKSCNVELRHTNFSRYPSHVTNFFNYAFKPLIIAETLKEFGAVFWVDSSSTFQKDRSIEGFLDRLSNMNKRSQDPDIFLFSNAGHTINSTTHPDMYQYLPLFQNGLTRQTFMYEAGLQLVYRTRATMELVYKWYVLCALEKNCIAPEKAQLRCDKKIWQGEYGECHRYDQSAINLILAPYESSRLQPEIVYNFIKTIRGLTVEDETKDSCDLKTPRNCFICQ